MSAATRAAGVAFALFALDALADLVAVASDAAGVRVLTKPALTPLLALGVAFASRDGRATAPFVCGLLASAAGDAALLGASDTAFVAGTLCFAVAHACYIVTFLRLGEGRGLVRRRPFAIVPYALAWLAGSALLWPHLGAFAAVVVPYGALVSAMALAALNLGGRVAPRAAALAASGAVLFVVSDSTIAFARFAPALAPPHAALVVMATYLLAQCGLSAGVLEAAGASRAGAPRVAA